MKPSSSPSALTAALSSTHSLPSTHDPYHKPRPVSLPPARSLTPTPVDRVRLPSLPGLVASVESDRTKYDAWQLSISSAQFLLPHHVPLHSIVAAAGDDILDELLTQACEEVGQICDGYVERVFDAEFQIDLDEMIQQDVEEQERQQQQHQHQQHPNPLSHRSEEEYDPAPRDEEEEDQPPEHTDEYQ